MPRRILLLNTDLEIGGTPTVVRELAWRLRDWAGAHVEVAGLGPTGPLQKQLWARNVKCTALGARGPRDFPRTLWRLLRLVKQERIDTVLSFLVHANTVAAALRPLYPRARYLQSIQTTQPNPRWHWRLQRLAAVAADRVIVPSPSIAAVARRWAGVPAEKLVVIPNVVDPGDFRLTHVPPARNQIRIGFLGRLDPIKRIPDLIAATSLLPPSFELHVFGDGPERPSIESEIARLNLAARVTLHGTIPRPQDALAKIDLLVLPSAAEGFGLVLIEAMAAGVPVVASDAPGIRDVVRNGETGLLVPVGAPAELARAIERISSDARLRNQLIIAGRADVDRCFSWQGVWSAYQDVLRL
ncbi:MAG: glycosyltransferase family 4 protein [Phycisphaerae bacterium]